MNISSVVVVSQGEKIRRPNQSVRVGILFGQMFRALDLVKGPWPWSSAPKSLCDVEAVLFFICIRLARPLVF